MDDNKMSVWLGVIWAVVMLALIGLQAVSSPLPNIRNGLPLRSRSICPLSDLNKAVGRTME